jgi:putative sensory transduction regulator
MSDPRAVVDEFVASLEGDTRQVAEREWGITVEAAGWPLHIGVAIRDGLLRAQAAVVGPGALDDHDLLWWNRTVPLISFAHTRAGEVWVQGDLPLAAVTPGELDRFLGLLVLSATQARQHAAGPGRGSGGSPTAPA